MNLDKRMQESGMISISKMLDSGLLCKFAANTDVKDIESFESWLEMRHKEFLEMQARIVLDKKEDDELYEWVLAHAAVLGEVRVNLKAALAI